MLKMSIIKKLCRILKLFFECRYSNQKNCWDVNLDLNESIKYKLCEKCKKETCIKTIKTWGKSYSQCLCCGHIFNEYLELVK